MPTLLQSSLWVGVFLLYAQQLLCQSTTLINRESMQQVKNHHHFFQEEINALTNKADAYLSMKPVSVMDKTTVASSGDKHDYMSQGPYWWPDPEKPDGLPYIRRDGEKNPEIEQFSDKKNLQQLIEAVDVLGLAYFYCEDEKYAMKATELLETWFLDTATRMNPNLNFGQAIPGRTEGRGIGIIETRDLGYLLDGVSLLTASDTWTEEHHKSFTQWMSDYLDWLIHSPHGKDEAVHGNNHTSWYFVQSMSLALFTGQDSLARDLQQRGRSLVIDHQIKASGEQPRELERTRSWDYSTMNLMAMYYFAILSEKIGNPVWNYQDQLLRKALDFLLPYLSAEREWEYQQITDFDPGRLLPVLKIAANHYPDGIYENIFFKKYTLSQDDLILGLRFP